MSYFPINPAMRFEAKLIPDVQKIPILNVLGQTEMEESPGWVEFTHEGHTYRLRPIYEDTANGKTLYFLFKDLTNKTKTYQAGRMFNVPLPKNGKVDWISTAPTIRPAPLRLTRLARYLPKKTI